MSLKEFFDEQKELRKQKKLLKKQQKKNPLTGEQKAYKIFGIILGISVTVGALAYSCSSLSDVFGSDVNWNEIVGISKDLEDKLLESVEINSLLRSEILGNKDWIDCQNVFVDAGLDIITNSKIDMDKLSNAIIVNNFVLTDRQIGAFIKESIEADTAIVDVYEINIFTEDNKVFLRSLSKVNVAKISTLGNIPNLIFENISELRVLDKELTAINSKLKINNLTDDEKESLVKSINVSGLIDIDSYANNIINMSLNTFVEYIKANIKITNDKILFYKD